MELNRAQAPSFLGMAFKSVFLLVGGIFLLVGVSFLSIGLGIWFSESSREQELAERGVAATATILERRVVRRERPTKYMVDLRFMTADGDSIVGDAQMQQEVWAELPSGGTLEIRYLPEDPSVHSVEGESSQLLLPLIFTLMGAVFTLIGGPLFWFGLKNIRVYRRLFREGMPTQGEITAMGPSNVRINNVQQWRIQYRYNDAMGGTHEGKSQYMSPEKAQEWKVGQTGEVRFDSRKPSLSAWIGRKG